LEVLLRLALIFTGLALAQQVSTILMRYFADRIAWTATNALRIDLANHCLNLDMGFHNDHTPGEMIERLDGDITKLSNFFANFVITIVSNVLLVMGILVLLWQVSWLVGASMTGFIVLDLLILLRLRNIAVPAATAAREESANLYSFLEERLNGIEEIKANGAKPYTMMRLYDRMVHLLRADMKEQWLFAWAFGVVGVVISGIGNILALATGAYLFQTTAITLGTVYLIFTYTKMIFGPIQAISRQVESLQQASASIERLNDLQRKQSAIHISSTSVASPTASALSIAFNQVSFGYSADMPVLKALTFDLQAGKRLGLLGRTGTGKTTLARLLFRLYDPQQGTIKLGRDQADTDIQALDLTDLRQRIGLITQNVDLFQGTVRDNLTLWDSSISDERLSVVLTELGLQSWLQRLPDGFDTVIESGGKNLSAGEGQLLALTRLFLRNPSIIILDEASSRLDPVTEAQLEQALDKLLQNRTSIIIAHRLQTVQRADEIMILDEGRIAEYGPRQSLAQDPHSQFSQLLQAGLVEVLA
ncbi:MAG: ABC transporter ATP-binding protein, partial [Chloroflexota bacterium]